MAAIDGFRPWVVEALGPDRMDKLVHLASRNDELDSLTVDAGTVEVTMVPLQGREAERWARQASLRGEDWAYVEAGETVLGMDELSEEGRRDPGNAVVFPELHMRLVSWWLFHAWRAVDLVQDGLNALARWRISSAVLFSRALIEQAGCLLVESGQLGAAWSQVKGTPEDLPLDRCRAARSQLHPVLLRAAFGSRIEGIPEQLKATSVLTYRDKLCKATGDQRFKTWYDWLSDAAHPAFGARIALSTPPMRHDSGGLVVRYHARSPMTLTSADGGTERLDNDLASQAADALVAAASIIYELLDDSLRVVDDLGLTTGAARLTTRVYWRNHKPVKGKRRCPCGLGPWSSCGHRWGEPAPSIRMYR
ncbi:hypothetical protein [Micromonospora noduli]|uniref:hypothetical protein n=1 Tax=Micromonospora noduli TaxID=709876 RepID=UPI000DBF88E7|nr:hypothetical protein [Micromonospora noduli]RAO07827.1 hypothetical protein GUI43_04282 [Micromonospora noduli]